MSLDKLVVNSNEIREDSLSDEKLFQLLKPYVAIEEKGAYGNINFHDEYDKIPARKQVIVCFFCVEALYRLGITKQESLDITTIFRNFKLDEGTHYPYIRNLEQDGVLWREDARYKIDSFHIDEAIEAIEKE